MPTSCTSAKEGKIKLLKERQSRWLNERKTFNDAVGVINEMEQDDIAASSQQYNADGFQQRDTLCADSSTALQKITERISSRIRDEIHREFAPTLNQGTTSSNLAVHLEEYLSSELHTHVCQICFELMKPPSKSPMMLFPCGHTFCKVCIEKHQNKGALTTKVCPYCREDIKSVAENQPLKQLIDRFASQRGKLENSSATTLNEVFPISIPCTENNSHQCDETREKADGSREINKYKAEHVSCSIRRKILTNELEELTDCVMSLNEKKESLQSALDMMVTEKGSVQRHMDCLIEQIKLINQHMEDQNKKIKTIDNQIICCEDQIKLIQLTVENLDGDIEKIRALGKAAGASNEEFYADCSR